MNNKMVKKNNMCSENKVCNRCENFSLCSKWSDFIIRLRQKNKFTGKIKTMSGYSHFDRKCSLVQTKMLNYVLDEKKITRHSFYPFITYTQIHKKIDGTEKRRDIFYCSHKDKCVYQRYSFLLNYHYNDLIKKLRIERVPIAYRTDLNQNNVDFANIAFNFIKSTKECKIIVGDFSSFFDNLNHKYLKEMICKVLNVTSLPDDYYAVFKNITRFSYFKWDDLIKIRNYTNHRGILKKMNELPRIISKEQFKSNQNLILPKKEDRKLYGIPQGSPISAVLSNVYMLDFDTQVNDYVKKLGGKYLRYSDDFIIIIPEIKDIECVFSFVEKKINNIDKVSGVENQAGLSLNEKKTHRYSYQNQQINDLDKKQAYLDYLGFIFNGKKIKVRRRSIGKYYYRMNRKAKTIRRNKEHGKKNKEISYKNIYRLYSSFSDRNTYIDYLKYADKILNLENDMQALSLIKNSKKKIRLAIKNISTDN